MSVQYTCPKCNEPNVDPKIIGGTIRCKKCDAWFTPETILKDVPPDTSTIKTSIELAALTEAQKIERIADNFVIVAICLFLVGVIAGLIAIVSIVSGENGYGATVSAGSFLAIAFWMYLVAQIIYIRALLTKK